MSFWGLAEVGGGDPRVLKAQLGLTAHAMRATRISAPFWALLVALLTSSITGMFGDVSFARTLFLPLAVGVTVGATALMASAYERYSGGDSEVKSWFQCFVGTQVLVSFAWGLMPWLCWQDGVWRRTAGWC